MATIAEALRCAERTLAPIAERDEPDALRIEAEVLLMHVLSEDRAHLLARMSDELSDPQLASFHALVARRRDHEPLSYIVGHCEFFGIEIACSPAALIPRPETEMLVELALDDAQRRDGVVRIADIGTGSGAMAVAIAANAPNVAVTATDLSSEAVDLARRNVERHSLAASVRLVAGDLLEGLGEFEIIVANLPYVREGEWAALAPEIREHEPRSALVGGRTGLEIIERLLRDAPAHLASNGVLAAEIGDTHGPAAVALGRACFPAAEVCVMKDLAGLDRMLVVRM